MLFFFLVFYWFFFFFVFLFLCFFFWVFFPILFFKGEQSSYITSNDMALIESIFPAAQIEIIPHAGHWLHAQNPQAFIANLKKHILN